MTVKELILELSKFDPEVLVTYHEPTNGTIEPGLIYKVNDDQYYDWEKKQHFASVRLS